MRNVTAWSDKEDLRPAVGGFPQPLPTGERIWRLFVLIDDPTPSYTRFIVRERGDVWITEQGRIYPLTEPEGEVS